MCLSFKLVIKIQLLSLLVRKDVACKSLFFFRCQGRCFSCFYQICYVFILTSIWGCHVYHFFCHEMSYLYPVFCQKKPCLFPLFAPYFIYGQRHAKRDLSTYAKGVDPDQPPRLRRRVWSGSTLFDTRHINDTYISCRVNS